MTDVRIAGVHINHDFLTLVVLDIVGDKIIVKGAKQYKSRSKLIDALQKNNCKCIMLEGTYEANRLAGKLKDHMRVGVGIIAENPHNENPDNLVTNKLVIDFTTQVNNEHRLLFPPKSKQSREIKDLQKQMSTYYEHPGEMDSVYYGPKEPMPDNYVRAFLLACLDAERHLPETQELKEVNSFRRKRWNGYVKKLEANDGNRD